MAKTYADNFNRTAASLTGSTSSDSLFTWSERLGANATTNGTQLAMPATDTHEEASADCDTDNVYVTVEVVSASGPWWLNIASNNGTYPGAGSHGYEIAFVSGNIDVYAKANGGFNSLITPVAHTVTPGTYRVDYNKATGLLTVSRNGTPISGASVTDTSEPGGAGNRKAAIGGNNGGGSALFDNFGYGDLVVAGDTFFGQAML
jgi:hypothetical protein